MKRIVSPKRLRDYATRFPQAAPALETWEKKVRAAIWRTPHDVKRTFNDVDAVVVGSGNTVYVFNIQRNEHRLVAAIHFNTGMIFVLRITPHRECDRDLWKQQL